MLKLVVATCILGYGAAFAPGTAFLARNAPKIVSLRMTEQGNEISLGM